MKPSFKLEKEYISLGYSIVAGVDEVGRGSIAGPLLSSAVILDINKSFAGLDSITDSKKLTADQRSELHAIIKAEAYDFAFGWVEVDEIDRIGIGSANILAFKRALDGLKKVDFALIDGRHFRGFDYKYRCTVKGELQSYSIAAASILAKVERDRKMEEIDSSGIYGFADNAGYGTEEHWRALELHGLSIHHRKTFVAGHLEQSNNNKLF